MHKIIYKNGGDDPSNYLLQWLDAKASDPVVTDGTPADGEDEQGFAARLYQLCLHALEDFYRQERDKHSSRSRSIILRECLGRLYLWGEPFGVGELDRALEQSDELRDNVLERLGHIGKLLLRALPPVIFPSKALHQPPKQFKELESVIKQQKLIVSGNGDEIPQNGHDSDEEYDSGREGSSDSGSYDIFEDIGFTTACLVELGPSLEQNLKQPENARVTHSYPTSVPFSVSGPATIYVSIVREKFKQAPYKLVERLGEANWQRHRRVREQMENTEHSPEEKRNLARESGIACSVFPPYSDFHDSGIGTSVPAQTEYAPSHTSFQSSNTEGEQVSVRVPREPSEVGAGKPFQCFLCRRLISNVKNRVDWKMHVFADLRPYICTFSDCRDELAQFTTRAAWADHEFTEHRNDRTWNCLECSKKLTSAFDWEQHLQEMHRQVFTGPQLHVARNIAYETQPRPIETEECPLCRVVLGKPRRAFVKHIGRHMEEIALMALPRNTEEDSDESSISTDRISSGSGNPERLAAETGLEAREEMSHDQTDFRATNLTTNQLLLADHETEASGLKRAWDHSQEDDVEDEGALEVTRCICGNQEDPGLPLSSGDSSKGGAKGDPDPAALAEDATGWFIQCDGCKVWQHGRCVGIMDEATSPEEYFCEQCRKDLHKIYMTVNARKCSLYLPVQQSQKIASEQKKMVGKFFVGAEVAYKQKEGEDQWIQCNIISISEVANNKRYEVQNPEPDENGAPGQIYKTTAAELIAIPGPDASLPDFPIGKQVLARYPYTTAFYRAEVKGAKKDVYRLKFEDDQDYQMEVERRFVLALGAPPPAYTPTREKRTIDTTEEKPAALGANQLLVDNGVNPRSLSDAQFATFQQQNPAGQYFSIQAYLRHQREDHGGVFEGDEQGESGQERFCYCDGVSYGEMIGCDGGSCERKWFHLACVGLNKAPAKNENWYCDECKENKRDFNAPFHARYTSSPEGSRPEAFSRNFDMDSERALLGIPPAQYDELDRSLVHFYDSWTGQPPQTSASVGSEYTILAKSVQASPSNHSMRMSHTTMPQSNLNVLGTEHSEKEAQRIQNFRGGRSEYCITCLRRHVRCDKGRPTCLKCSTAGLLCEGYKGLPVTFDPHVNKINLYNSTSRLSLMQKETEADEGFVLINHNPTSSENSPCNASHSNQNGTVMATTKPPRGRPKGYTHVVK